MFKHHSFIREWLLFYAGYTKSPVQRPARAKSNLSFKRQGDMSISQWPMLTIIAYRYTFNGYLRYFSHETMHFFNNRVHVRRFYKNSWCSPKLLSKFNDFFNKIFNLIIIITGLLTRENVTHSSKDTFKNISNRVLWPTEFFDNWVLWSTEFLLIGIR
jgi:hypothetical protein